MRRRGRLHQLDDEGHDVAARELHGQPVRTARPESHPGVGLEPGPPVADDTPGEPDVDGSLALEVGDLLPVHPVSDVILEGGVRLLDPIDGRQRSAELSRHADIISDRLSAGYRRDARLTRVMCGMEKRSRSDSPTSWSSARMAAIRSPRPRSSATRYGERVVAIASRLSGVTHISWRNSPASTG